MMTFDLRFNLSSKTLFVILAPRTSSAAVLNRDCDDRDSNDKDGEPGQRYGGWCWDDWCNLWRAIRDNGFFIVFFFAFKDQRTSAH